MTARREDGATLQFAPRYVLDATDLGDVLALCGQEGTDWVMGAESRAATGEPDAPATARPDWVQPFTFPFALDWSPATRATNVIPRPARYTQLKAEQKYAIRYGAITGVFQGQAPWWTYRRLLAAANFADPRIASDLSMINTPGNDYHGGNLLGLSAAERQATLARAREVALGYVYWLQPGYGFSRVAGRLRA